MYKADNALDGKNTLLKLNSLFNKKLLNLEGEDSLQ